MDQKPLDRSNYQFGSHRGQVRPKSPNLAILTFKIAPLRGVICPLYEGLLDQNRPFGAILV